MSGGIGPWIFFDMLFSPLTEEEKKKLEKEKKQEKWLFFGFALVILSFLASLVGVGIWIGKTW